MRVSMRFAVIIAVVTMGMSTLSLGTADPVGAQSPKRFVIVGAGGSLPADFEALIGAAGGTVVHQMDQIGVAVVESSDPSFLYAAEGIAGVQGMAEDRLIPLALPETNDVVVAESLDTDTAAVEGAGDTAAMFYPFQWNLKKIGAPAAWNVGKGDPQVKVAVLDTGIDYGHVDLMGKVDPERSTWFVTESVNGGKMYMDMNGHGTHVAGIIAASGKMVAGIAPNVTLIAVKVANKSGFAAWSTIILGIVYAADAGADVINMSFGDCLVKNGRVDPSDVTFGACLGNDSPSNPYKRSALLMAALNRAVNYAHSRGALLVASAGNNGINWDRAGNIMKLPAQLPHVVAVSATGPKAGDELSMDNMAIAQLQSGDFRYTDYGMSIISLAAPGGSATRYRETKTLTMPNGRPITLSWPVDWITSTCSRAITGCTSGSGVQPRAGTSMAAAHLSGVAALVDSAHGGALTGDQILNILMRTAEDYGKSGKDELYGFGRINAFRAVTGK